MGPTPKSGAARSSPATEEVSPIPFKSEKQRRYLHANEPAVAKKWEHESKGKAKKSSPKKKGRT